VCLGASGGSRLGPRGHRPPNLAQPPHFFRVITVHKLLNTGQLDTVVLLVVASQMMRGQGPPPNIFFLEPPLLGAPCNTLVLYLF